MRSRAGVTLIELVIVLALVSLVVGIMFPAVSSGVDSLRLQQASGGVAGFLQSALSRADRRQVAVEITIDRRSNTLTQRSTEPGFVKELEMPDGVRIVDILPERPDEDPTVPRRFLLYPGGSPPRIGVLLENRRLARRIVRLDPVTGIPDVATVPR